MSAQLRTQQKSAAAALAARRGRIAPEDLRGMSRIMYSSMVLRELEDLASPRQTPVPNTAITIERTLKLPEAISKTPNRK